MSAPGDEVRDTRADEKGAVVTGSTDLPALLRHLLERLAAGDPTEALLADMTEAWDASAEDLTAIHDLMVGQILERDRHLADAERFERLANGITDALWDWDLRDGRVWRNNAMTTVFGYPSETVAPTLATWTSAIHPEDRDAVLGSLHRAIDGDDDVWMREYRMLRHDGSVAHVSDRNHIVRDDHGTAIRVVGGITDISPRWEVEQALRLSEARYRQLAEHSAEGIFLQILHPERRFDYLNPAMEAMVGYRREAVYADPSLITGAIPDADRKRMRSELARSGVATAPLEVELRHRDGQVRHVRIRGVPQRDATGRVVNVQAVVTDVTREHLEQLALHQALDEQRELSDLKTAFVQAVSHELRTPLTSIRGFVELLLRRELEPAEQRRYLLRVASGADRLNRLVADVLDLDRFEGPDAVLEQERIDLADLARRAATEADTGTHPLHLDLACVPVLADGPLLGRVVDNLIRNAVKHTPDATPVWIRTRAPGTIIVEDAGPGVREALHETLFEPFRPGPDQRHHPAPGIGVGLALSRRIVRLHHGDVVFDERPGGGSRFTVTLPPE